MAAEHRGNVQVRRAVIDDAPLIAALLHRSFVEFYSCYSPEGFASTTPSAEQIKIRVNEGPIWVAIRDDIVVGTISAVPKKEGLYIRSTAVDPTVRGLGIGRNLLEHVESYAAQNGFKLLLLSTTPFLTQAIQIYERFGFHRSDEGPHDLFGTPLFTMVKVLPEARESRKR